MHHCCEINNNSVSLELPTLNPSQCLTPFSNYLPVSLGRLRGYRKLSVMFLPLGWGSLPVCVLVHLLLGSLMLAVRFGSNRTKFPLSKLKCAASTTETIVSNHLQRQLKPPPPPTPPTDEAKMQDQMRRFKSNQKCRFMRNDLLRRLIRGWGGELCTKRVPVDQVSGPTAGFRLSSGVLDGTFGHRPG